MFLQRDNFIQIVTVKITRTVFMVLFYDRYILKLGFLKYIIGEIKTSQLNNFSA